MAKNAKGTVPSVYSMHDQLFRMHMQKRHPNVGFWTRNNHDHDHRDNNITDHTHTGEIYRDEKANSVD